MVTIFLQTLIGPTYKWYVSLPTQSISSFNDFKSMFMTMYAQPISYHTLLTQFTQIPLKKGERIKDFNLQFFNTLNQIPEVQCPNDPIIFGYYNNYIPSNVNYAIRASQKNDLNEAIQKATKMEKYMLQINVDLDIILGKVQIQMTSLSIAPQRPYTSRSSKNREIGGGILQFIPLM
jgi:hypothetical protein